MRKVSKILSRFAIVEGYSLPRFERINFLLFMNVVDDK